MQQSSSAQERLVLDNMDLVKTIINQTRIPDYEKEDATATGTLGLVRAAKLYDGGTREQFRKFATRYVKEELAEHYPEFAVSTRRVSRKELNNTQADTAGMFEAVEARAQYEGIVNYVLNCLDSDERYMLLGTLAGIPADEIAKHIEDATEISVQTACTEMIQDIRDNPEVLFVHLYESYMSADYDKYRIAFFPKDIAVFTSSMYIFRELIRENGMKVTQKGRMVELSFPSDIKSTAVIMHLIRYIERREDLKFRKYPKQTFLDLM